MTGRIWVTLVSPDVGPAVELIRTGRRTQRRPRPARRVTSGARRTPAPLLSRLQPEDSGLQGADVTQRHRQRAAPRRRAWEPRSRRCRREDRLAQPPRPPPERMGTQPRPSQLGRPRVGTGARRSAYGACSVASVWAGSRAQSLSSGRLR